ncbi:RNA polymerase sigma factor [Porticoccaceae bacterium]|nr:RNA polymerase sigma factor [Porticoccaceae bacterium]
MTENHHPGKARSSAGLSAVTRTFLENSAYLQAFLRRFLPRQQDIEDVAQEAYLKAYSVEQGKVIDHPKAFLFTIAKNIAINELTKKTRQVSEYIEECKTLPMMESSATAEDELEAQQTLGVYCEAVAALPEQCRRVYLLRRVHGLRQQEIADSLGISVRAVQKHLQKGTLKCRRFIDEKGQAETVADRDGHVYTLPMGGIE